MELGVHAMCALAAIPVLVGGCYAGPRARRDVDAAWRGRSRADIVARWGTPNAADARQGSTELHWLHNRPQGRHRARVTEAAAAVDSRGKITHVDGSTLEWGPPNDANLRWGTILGLELGAGALDFAPVPLPSGGYYVGGMLGPRFGLVGCFSLVAGHATDGNGGDSNALAWTVGMAAMWWPITRVSVRAGPVFASSFDFPHGAIYVGPGVTGGVGYAIAKIGTFVLDLRADVTTAWFDGFDTFGTVGVGVNLN